MPDRTSDIQRAYEEILRQHAGDKDSGYDVCFHVIGWLRPAALSDRKAVESTTDSEGCAVLTYTWTHAGPDRVRASAVGRGPAVVSNTGRTLWVNALRDGEIGDPGSAS
jgi:hypothetical protein